MLKVNENKTGFTFISALLTIIVGVAMLLGGVVSHANAVDEEPQTVTIEAIHEADRNAGRFCVVAETKSGQAVGNAQRCGGDTASISLD